VELLRQWPAWQASAAIVLANYALYFALAGGAYALFYRALGARLAGRAFSRELPGRAQIRRELASAMKVMLAPSALSLLVFHVLAPRGIVRMYPRLGDYGLAWYAASFVLLFALHDTVNYWTHRTMHHRLLYRVLHSEHHLSVYPTPWGAFSSSLTEITLNSLGIVLGLVLMPTHESVLPLFTIFSVGFTVYGHIGYALAVNGGGLVAGGAHHAWHHRHVAGNYGMYTRVWDRLLGTDRGLLAPHGP